MVDGMTDMRMRALVDRRAMALRDLEETNLQASEGEIDADTADELLGRFRRDVARVEREIEELEEDLKEVQPPDMASEGGRSVKRALAGVLGLVVLLGGSGRRDDGGTGRSRSWWLRDKCRRGHPNSR